MDAEPIFSTRDFMQAQAACEELRAHDIKCGFVEGAPAIRSDSEFDQPAGRLAWATTAHGK